MISQNLANQIIDTIRSVVPSKWFPLSLHEPKFAGEEWANVKDCLDSNFVSTVGQYVGQFESDLKAYTGSKYAVAVVNGTAALQVCYRLAGVEAGDEVLIPSLSFVATANAVAYVGAKPHFYDVNPETFGIDLEKLNQHLGKIGEVKSGRLFNKETGARISALVSMHTFGHPAQLEEVIELCKKFHLEFIEDAAESLGSTYQDRHAGTFGKVSALSFNGNKIITTGGGGAILTQDEKLAHLAKHLTTTARVPSSAWDYTHDEVGYNFRLPNINAALGCAQLKVLPSHLRKKRILAEKYAAAFSEIAGIKFFREPYGAQSNYWLNAIILDQSDRTLRDTILAKTAEAGIATRPVWRLLHNMPAYKHCPRMDLAHSLDLENRIINLPSSPFLVED